MGSGIVRLTTESELRSVQTEAFINNTGEVNKISDNSALSGIVIGNSKVAKKAIKDIALAVSRMFPDSATGSDLDDIALERGIAARFSSSQSTTYVRVVASTGTSYTQGTHTFSGPNGVVFDLQESLTVGDDGYGYVKIRSQESGSVTNADPYTINKVSPIPSGHIGVINEYASKGGRDSEQDDVFRARIKSGPNILSRGTLEYINQAFMSVNTDVLRTVYEGVDSDGKVVLGVLTQNGIDLTDTELTALLEGSSRYLSLNELNPIGTTSFGLKIKNVTYQAIDVEFRVDLLDISDLPEISADIQAKFSKNVDFRFWDSSKDTIDWEDLLFIAQNSDGVRSLPDRSFEPSSDITLPNNVFPKFRGFIVRDLDGNIIEDQSGNINPVFYPNDPDESFQQTVLS